MVKRMYLTAIFLLIPLIVVTQAMGMDKIRVGYIEDLSLTPFFVAMDKGFFKEVNLDLDAKEYVSGNDSYTALKGRLMDIHHNVGANAAAKFHSQGMGVQMFHNLITKPHFKVLVKKDAPYTSISDLKGKTYAVTSFAGTTYAISAIAFSALGIDIKKDITVKTFPPAVIQVEMDSGTLDGTILWQPLIHSAIKDGRLRILEDPGELYYKKFNHQFISAGPVCYGDFLKDHPDIVRRYVQAFLKGVKFTLENADEANRIHAAHWKGFEAADIAAMRKTWGDAWNTETVTDRQIEDLQFMLDKMTEMTDFFKEKPVAREVLVKP